MSFDFKKVDKDLYSAKASIKVVDIPAMNFIAIKGNGDPNEEDGLFQQAIQTLYPVAYKLRMSYKTDYQIKDFEPYVVPPLEGLWWQEGIKGYDPKRKDLFKWILMLRIPDFISKKDVEWAKASVLEQKQIDTQDIFYFEYEEGLCAQIMHVGKYDEEFDTVASMNEQLQSLGYCEDFDDNNLRYHHEIYLSDIRKTAPEKLKTIIRHPIKK